MRVVAVAPLNVAQQANRLMQRQAEGGVILFIGSVAALRPSPGTAAYGAAKAGVLALVSSLAVEWAPRVRVAAISPGLIRTEQSHLHYGDENGIQAVGRTIPAGRMGEPDAPPTKCGVSIVGTERLAASYRRGFPRSLDEAPFLLPSGDSGLRLALEDCFRAAGIRPRVVGTFEDSALIDAFGRAGAGLLAMPTAIEAEARRQYHLRLVGRLPEVRQRFYAITVERKLRNPAVIAISERAKALFA